LAVGRWDIPPQLFFPDMESGKGLSLLVLSGESIPAEIITVWKDDFSLSDDAVTQPKSH